MRQSQNILRKRILQSLKEKNISQRELARRIGISSGSLSRILMGKVQPTLPTLQKIGKGLGKSLGYFDGCIKGDKLGRNLGSYGVRHLPVLTHLPEGEKGWSKDDVSEWVEVPASFARDYKTMFLTRAKGDSMEGVGIFDGDLVAVTRHKELSDGSLVLVKTDFDVMIRRCRIAKNKIRLEPANSAYSSEYYRKKNNIDIKGVVIWSVREHLS